MHMRCACVVHDPCTGQIPANPSRNPPRWLIGRKSASDHHPDPPRLLRRETAGTAQRSFVRSGPSAARCRENKNRPEVVDVGQRRAGDHLVAERGEEAVAVVAGERRRGVEPARAGAREACPGRPPRRRPRRRRRRRRCRRPAPRCRARRRAPPRARGRTRRSGPPMPSPRRVTVHSPPESSRTGAVARGEPGLDPRASRACSAADLARLALDGVAEHAHRRSRRPRPPGGGGERLGRRGDHPVLDAGEPRRAGRRARRSGPASTASTEGGHGDRASERGSRARRRPWTASPTVGPEAMKAGSSPGTSEIISASMRAGQAAAASCPPLTRRQVLAHDVHRARSARPRRAARR